MRTLTDALRSMGRYVSECLQPQPLLAEFTWLDTAPNPDVLHRWTTNGMVDGAVEVSRSAWGWMREHDRMPPTVTGPEGDPYYTSAFLVDPRPAATLAGFTLDTGVTVVGYDLPQIAEYEVRFAGERGDFAPPFARVDLVTAGGTSGPALYYERTQPMSIECYPVPAADAETALFAATAVLDALERGFRREGIAEGRPVRVPLWDYDGVTLNEAATYRGASDFMSVVDFSPRTLPDPQDPRRCAAIVDVRVSWRIDVDKKALLDRFGHPVEGSRIVSSVNTEVQPS